MSAPTPTKTVPAPTRDFSAEAFVSIEAPDEPAARRALKDTLEAIDELLEQRRDRDEQAGVRVALCMEDEHDRYAVEEV